MSDFKWVRTEDSRPDMGAPVLIKYKSTIQHISYTLDGCCNDHYWFEPYHFDAEEEDLTIDISEVSEWAYFPK